MLKLCSPFFPLHNMPRISASPFHTGLSQQPPSALLQSTAVPNRSTSYRQQTLLCLYSPFYDYHWPAAAMTLQLALEDVEALYLGWCCDDKCSQNTTSKLESVANQLTWHLNLKILICYDTKCGRLCPQGTRFWRLTPWGPFWTKMKKKLFLPPPL